MSTPLPADPPPVSTAPLPRWVRVLDGLTLLTLAVGLAVAVFGGARIRFDEVRLSLMSAPRILLVAAVLAALRHAIVRRDPLHWRTWRMVTAVWRDEALRAVWPVWVWSRATILLVGFLAVATIGFPAAKAPFRVYHNELLNLPARLDTGWYFSIATEGYTWSPEYLGQQNIAFMPALPMMMRVGGKLIGDHPLLAGQIIVLVACLWGFVYLYRLARELLGDGERAGVAVALLAAYPFAVFFGAVYTESLFLLSAAGGFYHARRRQVWPTALLAALAGFARPNGFLLSVPLGVLILTPALLPSWTAWRTWTLRSVGRALRDAWPMLAAAAAGVAGVLIFSAYVYALTGRPLTWLESHAAWGRTFTSATDFITGPYNEMERRGVYGFVRSLPIDSLNGLGALLALVAVIPVTRRWGPAYGVFILINMLPPLMVGGWLSIGRVSLGMFPMFLWLAAVVPARHRVPWLITFAALQALGAALFYTWRPFI
jgi:hypothetical protein